MVENLKKFGDGLTLSRCSLIHQQQNDFSHGLRAAGL